MLRSVDAHVGIDGEESRGAEGFVGGASDVEGVSGEVGGLDFGGWGGGPSVFEELGSEDRGELGGVGRVWGGGSGGGGGFLFWFFVVVVEYPGRVLGGSCFRF